MRLDPETNPAHDLAGQRAAVRIDYGYDDSGNRKAIDDVRILSGTRSLSIGLLLTMAYTGGLGVSNSGLYYAQQRYYDAHLGRWLTPDPIGFSGGLNLYAYAGNDPTGRVDPSGLLPEDFWCGMTAEDRAVSVEARGQTGDVLYRGARMSPTALGFGLTLGNLATGGAIDSTFGVDPGGSDLPITVLGGGPVTRPFSSQPGRQRHHVVQNAAVRELPGYSRGKAPTVPLSGQAKVQGTPHNCATSGPSRLNLWIDSL